LSAIETPSNVHSLTDLVEGSYFYLIISGQ